MLDSSDNLALFTATVFSLLAFYRVILKLPTIPKARESRVLSLPDLSFDGEVAGELLDVFQTEGLSSSVCSRASGSVNLDFFGAKESAEGLVSFYLGDVSGKGLAASLYQATCVSTLQLAASISLDPVGIVSEVNETLCRRGGKERFATLVYGTLEISSGRLRLLSAGHPNPIKISKNSQAKVMECAPCLPVGISSEHKYALTEHYLQPGDSLLLYSDGVTEARDSRRDFLGECGLLKLAERHHCGLPGFMVESVLDQVQEFSPTRKDDQTLMILHYSGVRSEYATNSLLQAV